MNIGDVAAVIVVTKMLNGKMKPKFGIVQIIGVVLFFLFLIGFIIGFIYGILNLNIEYIVMCSLSIFAISYILLISPYTQNPKNYYIEFETDNSLNNFKLTYKNKLVNIKYKIDNSGKIAFYNNKSKLSCISYADGSQMSNFTKYRIMNYFTRWLNDNKIMSDEITTTFEEL